MNRIKMLVTRGLFATGILGTLGFGVLQVTATPASAAARACFDAYCDDLCTNKGYTYGFCDTTLHKCVCVRV